MLIPRGRICGTSPKPWIELDDGDYAIVNKRAGELASRMLTVASNVVECNLRDSGGDLVSVCPDL